MLHRLGCVAVFAAREGYGQMLIDANDIEARHQVEADLCIIGGGAAGLTIARLFRGSTTSVCVLEGGGLQIDPASEAVYRSIRNVGRSYPLLYGSRLRFLGGSTNIWGGHCVPLRAVNFERLPWSRYSGWPVTLADLEPYYRRAEVTLGIDGVSCDPTVVAAKLKQPLFPFDPQRVLTVMSRYNRLRFGSAFRDELSEAANIRLICGANVTSIDGHKDGKRVEQVTVRTLGGRTFGVRARAFVLAAGGIENPRLLLVSRSVQPDGLGNDHDLVGRFFMEHIWYSSGVILPAQPQAPFRLYTEERPPGAKIAWRAHLALPEKVVREGNIPDFRAELFNINTWDASEAVQSVALLRRSAAQLDWPDDITKHIENIIRSPDEVLGAAIGRSGPHGYEFWNNVEQAPNPSSRIGLAEDRDPLGVPVATIDWRLSDIDKEGIRYAHRCIAREVGRSGFGRMLVNLPEEEPELLAGANGIGHHIGTTRMSDDPRMGVVDRNCRVHGLANLFVAGSSVFPTGGYANPTMTIVALAERLGDHLKDGLRAAGWTGGRA